MNGSPPAEPAHTQNSYSNVLGACSLQGACRTKCRKAQGRGNHFPNKEVLNRASGGAIWPDIRTREGWGRGGCFGDNCCAFSGV